MNLISKEKPVSLAVFLPPSQHAGFCCAFLSNGIVLQFRSLIRSRHLHREHRKLSLPQRSQGSVTGVFNAFVSVAFASFSIAFSTSFPILLTFMLLVLFPFRLRNTRKGEKRNSPSGSESLFTDSYSHSHSIKAVNSYLPVWPNNFYAYQKLYCRMVVWYLFKCCHTSLSKQKGIWIIPESQQMCSL